jgi:quinol-cytochrome oxidoreductase complex cytochrome b subunit
MFMFQTLRYLPATVLGIPGDVLGIVGFGVVAVVLLLIPFLDQPKSPDARPGRLWTWLAFAALTYIIAFTYLGYTFNPTT